MNYPHLLFHSIERAVKDVVTDAAKISVLPQHPHHLLCMPASYIITPSGSCEIDGAALQTCHIFQSGLLTPLSSQIQRPIDPISRPIYMLIVTRGYRSTANFLLFLNNELGDGVGSQYS